MGEFSFCSFQDVGTISTPYSNYFSLPTKTNAPREKVEIKQWFNPRLYLTTTFTFVFLKHSSNFKIDSKILSGTGTETEKRSKTLNQVRCEAVSEAQST